MKILYIGSDRGTSNHRRKALERDGHVVEVIDPLNVPGLRTFVSILIWRFGGFGLSALTYIYVRLLMKRRRYEICFVNHGETVGPALIRFLKTRCWAVTCYNADNPFVSRDGNKWRICLKALPYYDTFFTPRPTSVEDAYSFGATKAILVVQSADEIVHRPQKYDLGDSEKYSSDVAFVGTWMPERGQFAAELLRAGVPLKIFGPNWAKAPEYEQIKSAIVINRFLEDDEYTRAIQYAKISLGLLSEGNQDLHTGRSVEIPVIGSLLCAKRTEQHLQMYAEGSEAVFWDNADECARICLDLLNDPIRIASLSQAGREKALRSEHFNQKLMTKVISETLYSVRTQASMHILYIGADTGTSLHRKLALERLGHNVTSINPLTIFGLKRIIAILIWRFGGLGLGILTHLYIRAAVGSKLYDFCFVNHGETISPAAVRFLKSRCRAVACYNSDNPFVERDGDKWKILLRALPYYDLYSTIRVSTMKAALTHGAKHAISHLRTADEIVHLPKKYDPLDEAKYSSDVAFVGTWMPERGKFMSILLEAGVPLKIYGANWRKASEFNYIKSAIAIDGFLDDDEYVKAIQYTKIALGLLSAGNEDLHTGRSVEIPAIGTLFCGMRTEEHLKMYRDGVEAVFWDDASECATKCLDLLANPTKIREIAIAGHDRMMGSGNFNEQFMKEMIEQTLKHIAPSIEMDSGHS